MPMFAYWLPNKLLLSHPGHLRNSRGRSSQCVLHNGCTWARDVMAKDARVTVPKWRWVGAFGFIALVVLAGLAWFLAGDHKSAQSAASQSAAAVPAPAVGVRPVVTKGVS